MTLDELIAASGRSCGECSLCCKLPRIPVLNKPAGKWCKHARPGKGGCSIYNDRPDVCRGFACEWLVNKSMGDEWFPAHSKIMFCQSSENTYTFHVDASVPNRWREAPYYEQIKHIALVYLVDSPYLVLVRIALTPTFLILPDEDKDISEWIEAGDSIRVQRRRDGRGFEAIRYFK
jgi:hypothetical protein